MFFFWGVSRHMTSYVCSTIETVFCSISEGSGQGQKPTIFSKGIIVPLAPKAQLFGRYYWVNSSNFLLSAKHKTCFHILSLLSSISYCLQIYTALMTVLRLYHVYCGELYYVVTHQNKGTESKIRIEYVLKSAEVRTFVSSWYSEDSSHTHLCIPVHTRAHLVLVL